MDLNVSRSGRVLKKSTKLADFESLTDGDLLTTSPGSSIPGRKKGKDSPRTHSTMSTSQTMKGLGGLVDDLPPDQLLADDQNPDGMFDNSGDDFDVDIDIKEEDFDGIPDIEGDDFEEDSDDSGERNLMIDDTKCVRGKSQTSRPISSSIYLSEKSSGMKKQAGTSGRNRVIRRDKGKRRITAFMLWARHMKKDVVDDNPRLDSNAIGKKLGDIWASVSNSEKDTWKRRAKKVSVKENQQKPTRQEVIVHQRIVHVPARTSPQRRVQHQASTKYTSIDASKCKAVSTQPLDAAAHLKLLGESLTIIGERLTEHEGQITVSGSLSVLLDSLLCALGPLVCLTQQVPELNVIPQDTLTRTLDNIAYIMPGL